MKQTIISFLFLASSVSAFLPVSTPRTHNVKLASTTEEQKEVGPTYFEDLVEAIDCASHFGTCDLEALEELAAKVDSGNGNADDCTFEDAFHGEECEHEINDRHAVAKMLRLQSELRREMESLDSNLFVKDVRAEHDIRDRDIEMEILGEDAM